MVHLLDAYLCRASVRYERWVPPGQQATRGDKRLNGRYVVDENGERLAVLLDIEEYERMVARQSDEPPDDEENFGPEEAERRITQFITRADELPGPPVEELAEQVAALMRAALRDLEAVMDGKPHNKVLATQLLLGQRARGSQPGDPEQWRLYAATTLLSGIVVRGAES
jgi:hypothetical protein